VTEKKKGGGNIREGAEEGEKPTVSLNEKLFHPLREYRNYFKSRGSRGIAASFYFAIY